MHQLIKAFIFILSTCVIIAANAHTCHVITSTIAVPATHEKASKTTTNYQETLVTVEATVTHTGAFVHTDAQVIETITLHGPLVIKPSEFVPLPYYFSKYLQELFKSCVLSKAP